MAEASTGTGTFALPSGLTGTLGTDYHIYLLAEHVNADNSTDYASEPKEVTAILDEVDTVTVPSIDTPIAEVPLKEEITVSSTGVAEKATLTWKKNDTEATGNAQWKTTYQAYVTLTATDGYSFMDATGNRPSVTLNGQPVDTENITLNADGTLTVYCGEYTTATRKTESATAPEVPTQFANYYTADNVLSSTELGTTAKVTLEGKTQPNLEEMEVEWAIIDEEGNATTYNATPETTNIFKWTVKDSEYADYNKNNAVLEGTVAIKNKDYTPVTITGEDVTVTYDGKKTLDVSQYFTIDKNAGTPTYVLSDTSTGTGTLEGATLTMTTLGTFVVKVSTSINGVYNKREHTLTITVNKAAPNVTALPTVADRIYHPSTALADTDITDGTVKDVSGNSLAGTWRWKEADVVPTVDNDGYVAVFTPEDAVHYQSVEKTISVNVSKATPYIKTAPTATAITYGEALSASTLRDAVVWYSESNKKAVEGTFTWKEAATKPTVADSDKTVYDVVFTPTDAENYNTVETKITLTVNKAASAPGLPNNTMEVDYSKKKVSDITTLPEGWAWQDEDQDKALTVGTAVKATAVYTGADKGNYETESVKISITRAECTHATTEVKDAKDATCTEKGYTGDTCCTVCGKVITAGTDINALGHNFADTFTTDKEATCTEEGSKSKHCSRCEEKDEVTPIPKKEHTWDSGTVTKAATCTEKGVKSYKCTVDGCDGAKTEDIEALGHDYASEFTVDKEATCAEAGSKSKHCSRCDAKSEVTEIPVDKTKHGKTEIKGAKDATCTEKGYSGDTYCKVCGEKVETGQNINALGHDFAAEFTVDKEATCAEAGSKSKHCSRCDEVTEVTPIDKLTTHNYVNGVCSVCDDIFKTTVDGVTYQVMTETGADGKPVGKLVTVSGNEIMQVAVAVIGTGDDFAVSDGKVTVPSEITGSGSEQTFVVTKLSENAFNGASVTEVVVPATVTEVGTGAFGTASTITFKGNTAPSGIAGAITETVTTVNVPEGAADSYREELDENANIVEAHTIHVKDEGTRVEPTCEKKGSITYKCTKCGQVMEVVELDATGHKWDAGKVTKEATETAEGVKTYTCSVCGKTKTEAIPKKTATTQEPPKKGDVVKDDKTSVKVEVSDVKKKEVEYKEPTNKKAKTVSIPATVKIDGVTYKVTKIDDNAFKNNKTVTKVTVGSNIKTIGKNAFSGATKLKTVSVGKNVTEVGANAFKGCSSLTSVTLGSKATKIGANAFSGCKKLKTIKITSKKLTSKTVSKNAFKGLTKATTIKVPKKKLSAYKKLFKQKGLSSKVKVKGY